MYLITNTSYKKYMYSEGQLSTEIAAKSTGLTIEEFLDRYEDYKG